MENGKLTAEEDFLLQMRDEYWRCRIKLAASKAWKLTYNRKGLCSKDGILIFLSELDRIK